MKTNIKNGKPSRCGDSLVIIDMDNEVTCDPDTDKNLREYFLPSKPQCMALYDNSYAATCEKDGEPCNGNFSNCRIIAKALQNAISQKARESVEILEKAVEAAGEVGAVG